MAMKPAARQIIPQKRRLRRRRYYGGPRPSPPLRTGTNGDPNLLIVSEAPCQQYATILQMRRRSACRLSPAGGAAGGGRRRGGGVGDQREQRGRARAPPRQGEGDGRHARQPPRRERTAPARAAGARAILLAQFGATRHPISFLTPLFSTCAGALDIGRLRAIASAHGASHLLGPPPEPPALPAPPHRCPTAVLAFIDTSAVGGGGGGRGLGGKALLAAEPRRPRGAAAAARRRTRRGRRARRARDARESRRQWRALGLGRGRLADPRRADGALSAAQTALEALGSEIGDDADDVAAASSRAATRVQAVHRGKSTRNSLGMAPGAAEVAEAAPAGDLYGNLGDIPSALHSLDLGGDRAATQLQSRHRGNLARQHGATQSATQLQSRHRGNLARRGLREPGLAAPATDHETIQAKLEEGLIPRRRRRNGSRRT